MMTIVYYDSFPMTFYRVPKYVYTMEELGGLSSNAVLLYGLILDRASLSKRNEWKDKLDRYYVYLSVDEAAEILKKEAELIEECFAELEDKGLIEIFKRDARDALIYPKVAIGTT